MIFNQQHKGENKMKLNKRHIGIKNTFKDIFFNEVFEGTVISLSRYNAEIETKSGIGVFSRSEIIIINHK